MVNGIPQVRAMFARKGAAVVAAGKAAAAKGGDQVADGMRYLVPVQAGPEGGDLMRSIRVEDTSVIKTKSGPRGFIGVTVKAGDATTVVTTKSGRQYQNARIQEFGTKSRAANPYFYPVWRANRTLVRSAISRAVRKAWVSG